MAAKQKKPATGSVAGERLTLRESLGQLPEPVAHPVLVAVSGLPGTGKSYVSQRLLERVPLAFLETDALRKALHPSPTYSAQESARLFRLTHELIEELLGEGIPVLLDATSLMESHREHLYNIADRRGVKLVLVLVEAPPKVVLERLAERKRGKQRLDRSDADWEVYQRLRPSVEPIRRNHYTVDTTREVGPVVEQVVREITRRMRDPLVYEGRSRQEPTNTCKGGVCEGGQDLRS